MQNQDINQLSKFQALLAKNPLAFVGAVFFLMFWITYFININKNNNAEQYWKELYEKERGEKDNLKNQLLIKAGIIERQKEEVKVIDSIIKKQTIKDATKILKNG